MDGRGRPRTRADLDLDVDREYREYSQKFELLPVFATNILVCDIVFE